MMSNLIFLLKLSVFGVSMWAALRFLQAYNAKHRS